jgi:hypothetical protein
MMNKPADGQLKMCGVGMVGSTTRNMLYSQHPVVVGRCSTGRDRVAPARRPLQCHRDHVRRRVDPVGNLCSEDAGTTAIYIKMPPRGLLLEGRTYTLEEAQFYRSRRRRRSSSMIRAISEIQDYSQ